MKTKNLFKLFKIVMSILILIGIGIFIWLTFFNEEVDPNNYEPLEGHIESFEIKINERCTRRNEPVLYFTLANSKVYTHCLERFIVSDGTKMNLLNKQLEIDAGILNHIIANFMEEIEVFNDGGSTLHQKGDLQIFRCNNLQGNRDIYIGTAELKHVQGLCS